MINNYTPKYINPDTLYNYNNYNNQDYCDGLVNVPVSPHPQESLSDRVSKVAYTLNLIPKRKYNLEGNVKNQQPDPLEQIISNLQPQQWSVAYSSSGLPTLIPANSAKLISQSTPLLPQSSQFKYNNQGYFDDINIFSLPSRNDSIYLAPQSSDTITESLKCKNVSLLEQETKSLYPEAWADFYPQNEDKISKNVLNQSSNIDNICSVANSNLSYTPVLISSNSNNLISQFTPQGLQFKRNAEIHTKTQSTKKQKLTTEEKRERHRINSKTLSDKQKRTIELLENQVKDLNNKVIQLYRTYLPVEAIDEKLNSLKSELPAARLEDQLAKINDDDLKNLSIVEQKKLKNKIYKQNNRKKKKIEMINLKSEKKLLKQKILEFHIELKQNLIKQNTSLLQSNESINQENQYLKNELKKYINPANYNHWNNFSGSLNSKILEQFPISSPLIPSNYDNLIQPTNLLPQGVQIKCNPTSKKPPVNSQELTLMSQVTVLNNELNQLYQTYLHSDKLNSKLQSLKSELSGIYESSKNQSKVEKRKLNNREQIITNLKLEKKLFKNKILDFYVELVQNLINQNNELIQKNECVDKENQYLKNELNKCINHENSNYSWNNFNKLK